MNLCIHLGFMPEEMSAKLKPALNQLPEQTSILIMTRDNIADGFLFEQPLNRYKGLKEAVEGRKYWVTNSEQPDYENVDLRDIGNSIQHYLNFDVRDYHIKHKKIKLSHPKFLNDQGRFKLNIIKVGDGSISDIYLQFPEMGFQSTLAPYLVYKILDGIFKFLKPSLGGSGYTNIVVDAFGAGGSLNPQLEPGSLRDISGIVNVRFAKKKPKSGANSIVKGRSTLRLFNENNKHIPQYLAFDQQIQSSNSEDDVRKMSIELEEKLRLNYIKLANFRLSEEVEKIPLDLSLNFQNYLGKKDPVYLAISEKLIENSNKLKDLGLQDDNTNNQENLSLSAIEEETRKEEELQDLSRKIIQIEDEKRAYHERKIIALLSENQDIEVKINKPSDALASLNLTSQTLSCSSSLFLDDAMKRASHIIMGDYAASANMEDDFIAKVKNYVENKLIKNLGLTAFPNIRFSCSRVTCDPFEFPESRIFSEKLNDWAKKKHYSIEHYVDAILWGASGFENSFLTDNSKWDFESQVTDITGNQKCFYKVQRGGRDFIVDPFWREIATDFLVDIINRSTVCCSDELVNNCENLRKKLSSAALDNLAGLRKEVIEFVRRFLTEVNFCITSSTDNSCKYKVWVRKGSWGNNTEMTLDQLNFLGSNLDRAFYISTNIFALQKHGEECVTQRLSSSKFWGERPDSGMPPEDSRTPSPNNSATGQ